MERKTTESTPIPNVEELGSKTTEFSPSGSGDQITNNAPEAIKDDSQTKRTSFTERFAAMVGMKPRDEGGDNSDRKEQNHWYGFHENHKTRPGEGATHRGISGSPIWASSRIENTPS